MTSISILLAEDHAIVREGIQNLLELEPDLKVTGVAQDGRSAVVLAQQLRPDVVLMDIAMPLLNGLEATRQIHRTLPATKVIMLSAHCDDAYIAEALKAGALGFILKQSTTEELCRAIRLVRDGKRCFSPAVAKRLHRVLPELTETRRMPGEGKRELTSRELEVLQLIAEGKANKETADQLGISVKTVEKHRGHLMEKLGIHNTAGLTRYAMEAGVIESRARPEEAEK